VLGRLQGGIRVTVEADCKKICNETTKRLNCETSALVNVMSRKATCVSVPQCVFWGVAIILAIALGALLSLACINYFTLRSKEVLLILAIATFFICSTIWSMLHYYAKDKN